MGRDRSATHRELLHGDCIGLEKRRRQARDGLSLRVGGHLRRVDEEDQVQGQVRAELRLAFADSGQDAADRKQGRASLIILIKKYK